MSPTSAEKQASMPKSEGRFGRAVDREAERREVESPDFLAHLRRRMADPSFPTDDCLDTDDLDLASQNETLLAPVQLDHLQNCPYCGGIVDALRADLPPLNRVLEDVRHFLESQSPRALEEAAALQQKIERYGAVLPMFGALNAAEASFLTLELIDLESRSKQGLLSRLSDWFAGDRGSHDRSDVRYRVYHKAAIGLAESIRTAPPETQSLEVIRAAVELLASGRPEVAEPLRWALARRFSDAAAWERDQIRNR
jgi:hypothetical protein